MTRESCSRDEQDMEEVRVLFIDAAVLTTRRRPSVPITADINIYGNVWHGL